MVRPPAADGAWLATSAQSAPAARPDAPVPRLRVLHTLRSLRVDGVTKVVLRNLAHRDAHAFDHHLCSLREERDLAGEAAALGLTPVFLGHTGPGTLPRTVSRMHALLVERGIDVVHCNRTADLAIAGVAARRLGVPVISTIHWLGRLDEHPEDRASKSLPHRWIEMKATVAINRILATHIVAVSDAVRASYASMPGFPSDRTSVVYPGLAMGDPPPPSLRDAVRARLGIDRETPLLLNVGRLHDVKGQRHLVPMMTQLRERLPGAQLLIAGEGELRRPLEAAIGSAGLAGAITLLGVRDDIDELLAACDLLVLCSESEAAPLPLFEAMRAGRAVVATRVGGVAEIVVEGETGLVVPRADPAALASAALRILETPGLAGRMGTSARNRGCSHFDISASVRALEERYRSLGWRRRST